MSRSALAEPVVPQAAGPASGQPWLPPQAGQGWRRKVGYLRQAIEVINAIR